VQCTLWLCWLFVSIPTPAKQHHDREAHEPTRRERRYEYGIGDCLDAATTTTTTKATLLVTQSHPSWRRHQQDNLPSRLLVSFPDTFALPIHRSSCRIPVMMLIIVSVRVRPFTIREAAQMYVPTLPIKDKVCCPILTCTYRHKTDDNTLFLGDGSLAGAPAPKLHQRGIRNVIKVVDDRCLYVTQTTAFLRLPYSQVEPRS
jgi:hypothetical protein